VRIRVKIYNLYRIQIRNLRQEVSDTDRSGSTTQVPQTVSGFILQIFCCCCLRMGSKPEVQNYTEEELLRDEEEEAAAAAAEASNQSLVPPPPPPPFPQGAPPQGPPPKMLPVEDDETSKAGSGSGSGSVKGAGSASGAGTSYGQASLPKIYRNTRAAKLAGMTVRTLGGCAVGNFSGIGSFQNDSRFGKSNNRFCYSSKINMSTSFETDSLNCNTCETKGPHPALHRDGVRFYRVNQFPRCFILSDQNFLPSVPVAGEGECLKILCIEDARLYELYQCLFGNDKGVLNTGRVCNCDFLCKPLGMGWGSHLCKRLGLNTHENKQGFGGRG
jgi:hypothetical protein